jgi:pimeloyl-ACP methyl ester carboxylesterase
MKINLNYIEQGQGEVFVLLHGNGESAAYFVHQIEYFSKDYRVIAVDTRGHGKSPRGDMPFTLNQFADDLATFLDQLGINKIILLGFSDGANISILFALKYPIYLSRLILNGANLFPSGVKVSAQIPTYIGYGMVALIGLFDKKALKKKELLGLMLKEPDINPEQLQVLEVPTLVIAGTNDMIKESHTELIHKNLRKSRLVYEKGDHFIAYKKSVAFNQKVEEFLKTK